jgi:CheY-like chemotaxis protein
MDTIPILIVEDERIIALELARRLRQLGYAVAGVVSSGAEAIQKAENLHPALVLMDVGLAGPMTGIEAGETIRATLQIPVVYISAYTPEHLRPSAQAAIPALYIQKPFDERRLRVILEQALGMPPSESPEHFERAQRGTVTRGPR